MTVLPLITTSAMIRFHHWLRKVAYDNMSRQASGWVPNDMRIECTPSQEQPIRLDFEIPKKHRIAWIQRTLHRLPH